MSIQFALMLYCGIAIAAFISIDSYLTRQIQRRWLGLSYGSTSIRNNLQKWLKRFYSIAQRDIEQVFINAGIYNRTLPRIYTSLKLLLASGLTVVIFLFGQHLNLVKLSDKATTAAILFSAILVIPEIILKSLQKKRIEKVSAQLPYILDLLAVCMQSGMTIEASTAYLGEELKSFDRDLSYIMKRLESVSKIHNMKQALQELAKQIPSQQMISFVYTLSQSLQYGSSIADVLGTQAAHIRQITMLSMEEQIGKLSAKMALPMISFIMLPIVVLMIAPGIMRLMNGA
ncbi:type II secretion system F family protein [Parendozoicomonas sp. Alg238-R29]|uniref:type II secretion system F family protein n=1 Tax=Parendozoicomonas sp. Alg238-R29 TaxID=2993446 RepID=UPI00248E28D8|nr:type II secretion system F family protein [Parendozoicomonas sp. Alg238-R29]